MFEDKWDLVANADKLTVPYLGGLVGKRSSGAVQALKEMVCASGCDSMMHGAYARTHLAEAAFPANHRQQHDLVSSLRAHLDATDGGKDRGMDGGRNEGTI